MSIRGYLCPRTHSETVPDSIRAGDTSELSLRTAEDVGITTFTQRRLEAVHTTCANVIVNIVTDALTLSESIEKEGQILAEDLFCIV